MTPRTERYAEVADLADAVLDAMAERGQVDRLGSLIAEDAEARAFYLDYMAMHADAAWERRETAETVVEVAEASLRFEPRARRVRPRPARFAMAMAAAVVIGGVAAAIALVALLGGPVEPVAEPDQPIAVATLIESRGVVWASEPLVEGHAVMNQPIRHERGSYEMMLDSGTTLNVIGGGELRIVTPMRVAMSRGRATFDCPPKAKGFTVDLPGGARVVDLGTRFTVRVDAAGDAVVTVIDGSVEVQPRRAEGATDEPTARRLVAGQTVAHASATGALAESAALGDVHPVDAGDVALDWNAGDAAEVMIDGEMDAVTLVAWVRFDASATTAGQTELSGLLMSDAWTGRGEVHWQIGDSDLRLTIREQRPGDTASSASAAIAERPERPVLLATTFDRATGRIAYYVDGEGAGEALLEHAEAVRIGAATVGRWRGVRRFPGAIERLCVYRTVLSDEQVRTLAAEAAAP